MAAGEGALATAGDALDGAEDVEAAVEGGVGTSGS